MSKSKSAKTAKKAKAKTAKKSKVTVTAKGKGTRKLTPYKDKWGGYANYHKKEVVNVPKLIIDKDDLEAKKQRMLDIFSIQSKTYNQDNMIDFVTGKLIDYGCDVEVDTYGNVYGTKGEASTYPCVVGHLDTVHEIIPDKDYKVYSEGNVMFAINLEDCTRTGIGGDDNVGIWVALELALRRDVVKVVFFKDEEYGTLGSHEADTTFFDDVSFVLEADRQGYKDFVSNIYSDLYGDEFRDAIQPMLTYYNKEESDGGLTDVATLSDLGINVAMANCSCGYYKPHTSGEYIKVDEVVLTYRLFKDIIVNVHRDGKRFDFKPVKKFNYNSYGNGYGNAWQDDYEYDAMTRTYKPKNNDTPYKAKKWEISEDEEEGGSKEKKLKYGDTGVCSFCGSQSVYDSAVDLFYCYNCNDYDYNNPLSNF